MSVILEQTEKEWDAVLFNSRTGLAPTLGWTLTYHTLRSKGSQSGFPDRVLVRDRVVYVELKRHGGKVSAAQREWLDGLARAGSECYVWIPSDLDEIGSVLAGKWLYARAPFYSLTRPRTSEPFLPNSLWIAGQGRRDNV